MFYCILANGLNFERNPRIVIRTEQPNFVWLGIGMWTLTYEELHVSVTAADNVFYPRSSLRVSPRTLRVARHDGDELSHSLNILRSSLYFSMISTQNVLQLCTARIPGAFPCLMPHFT